MKRRPVSPGVRNDSAKKQVRTARVTAKTICMAGYLLTSRRKRGRKVSGSEVGVRGGGDRA